MLGNYYAKKSKASRIGLDAVKDKRIQLFSYAHFILGLSNRLNKATALLYLYLYRECRRT